MEYKDFDDEMKLECWFITCEMTLIFFQTRPKIRKFNVFCDYIRNIMLNPPYNPKSLHSTTFSELNNFLMSTLKRQYGFTKNIATNLIVDFFIERRWSDIYEIQMVINEETLPNGYANNKQIEIRENDNYRF